MELLQKEHCIRIAFEWRHEWLGFTLFALQRWNWVKYFLFGTAVRMNKLPRCDNCGILHMHTNLCFGMIQALVSFRVCWQEWKSVRRLLMLTFLRLKFQYKPLHPMKFCWISTFKSRFLTCEMCTSSSTSKIVQLDKVLFVSFLGEISIYKYHLRSWYKYHLWLRELFSIMPLLCEQPRSFWSNLILVFLFFSTVSAKVKST